MAGYRSVPADGMHGVQCVETTVTITDDADATLIAGFSPKKFIAALPTKEQNFNGGAYINYYTINATGTSVVATCSTSVASAVGDVKWRLYFESN